MFGCFSSRISHILSGRGDIDGIYRNAPAGVVVLGTDRSPNDGRGKWEKALRVAETGLGAF